MIKAVLFLAICAFAAAQTPSATISACANIIYPATAIPDSCTCVIDSNTRSATWERCQYRCANVAAGCQCDTTTGLSVCPPSPSPVAGSQCGNTPPDPTCTCLAEQSATSPATYQWNCTKFCAAATTSGAVDTSRCVCLRSTNGWSWQRCPLPPASPSAAPPTQVTRCLGAALDSTRCQCACDADTTTSIANVCLWRCLDSVCNDTRAQPSIRCKCLQMPTVNAVAPTTGSEPTYPPIWVCPPESPQPASLLPPPSIIRSGCDGVLLAPGCECHCVTSYTTNTGTVSNTAVGTSCYVRCRTTECYGLPPNPSCTCATVDAATGLKDWVCTPNDPCANVPAPASILPCQCGVVRLNPDGSKVYGYLCGTCNTQSPRSDCRCAATRYDETSRVATLDWSCPVTCEGAPSDPANCECAYEPTTNVPTWNCKPTTCNAVTLAAGTDATRCYCSTLAGTSARVCPPRNCDAAINRPSPNMPCTTTEMIRSCDASTGQWVYTCPPRTCTCDGLPLPRLSTAVDGCTTDEARWSCEIVSTSGGVVLAANTAGATVTSSVTIDATRACATWKYECPRVVPVPPRCKPVYQCNTLRCIDETLPQPQVRCPYSNSTWDCASRCTRLYGTCVETRSTGVAGCDWQYSREYRHCIDRCNNVQPPTDRCSFITDKCGCLSTNGNCGWCEASATVAGASVSVGKCVSTQSDAICRAAEGYVFRLTSAAADRCAANTPDPFTRPAPTLPTTPTRDEATTCARDERCFKPNDVNDGITRDRNSATVGTSTRDFVVVTTIVIEATRDRIRVGVDVVGDRQPTTTERQSICDLVARNVLSTLRLDRAQLLACAMDTTTRTSKKRQASNEQSSNVVTMSMRPESTPSAASAVFISALALLAGLIALVF